MKKINRAMIISSVLMILLSGITVVLAWFTIVEKTTNIIIYSGTVETEYQLINTDTNAVINNQIVYEKVLPGAQYNYRLTISNAGTIHANLKVVFNFGGTSNDIKAAFTLNDATNSYNFTESRTIVDGLILYPAAAAGSSTYIYNFSIVFDSDYEDKTFDQVAFIESIVITLEQTY